MLKIISILRYSLLVIILSTLSNISLVHADTGLCPSGYSEGIVSTGFVDCYDSSSPKTFRADAEVDRVQIEGVCLTVAGANVESSQIFANSSGKFFAEVTCRVPRPTPPGTVFCPLDSSEALRAFDTLVCEYFGNAAPTMSAAQAMLATQTSDCLANTGRILESAVGEVSVDAQSFFFPSLACAITIAPIDVIQCPYGFNQISIDTDSIECAVMDDTFASLAEAQAANLNEQNICTSTTTGLGTITSFLVGVTSSSNFFSTVVCTVNIAKYGEFVDDQILRACDASCTEDLQQIRPCLNGGKVGGPGCTASATQVVVQRCNTGTNSNGLCPLILTPNAIAPLLLLDDDEED